MHPSLEDEKRKHKKKRLVQSPNSYFMDVKCPGRRLGEGAGGGRGARFPPGAAPRPNAAPSPPPRALPAGCYKITTVFSHAQTVVLCVGCSTVLCQPTGGKARLTEGAWGGRRAPGGRHGTVNRWVKKWLGLYGAFFR